MFSGLWRGPGWPVRSCHSLILVMLFLSVMRPSAQPQAQSGWEGNLRACQGILCLKHSHFLRVFPTDHRDIYRAQPPISLGLKQIDNVICLLIYFKSSCGAIPQFGCKEKYRGLWQKNTYVGVWDCVTHLSGMEDRQHSPLRAHSVSEWQEHRHIAAAVLHCCFGVGWWQATQHLCFI